MGAGNKAVGYLFGRGMGATVREQIGQHMGVRTFRAFAIGRGDRLIDLDPSHAADEDTRWVGGEGSRPSPGFPAPATCVRIAGAVFATTSGSAMRTQRSACKAPMPRSNRMPLRSSSRNACVSGPSSVRTARWFMAHWSSRRHNAMRWAQLSRVVDSEANSRKSPRGSMRTPPRARHGRKRLVTARDGDRLVRVTHEFRDSTEGSETPLRFRIAHLGGQKLHTVDCHSTPPHPF